MKAAFSLALVVAAFMLMTAASVPLRASETDDRIKSAFENSYVHTTYLTDDTIQIDVSGGVVTLTGNVADDSHKALAQETVAGLPGVARVDNQLQAHGEIPAANSDACVGAKVRSMFAFHRAVGNGAQVDVKDGTIILSGVAATASQREQMTQYAQAVEGAKEVRNDMTIDETLAKPVGTNGRKIDDASITAQAKLTLQYHCSNYGLATKVETRNGVVRLSGKARSRAERNMVSMLIAGIDGVACVVDIDNRIATCCAAYTEKPRTPAERTAAVSPGKHPPFQVAASIEPLSVVPGK